MYNYPCSKESRDRGVQIWCVGSICHWTPRCFCFVFFFSLFCQPQYVGFFVHRLTSLKYLFQRLALVFVWLVAQSCLTLQPHGLARQGLLSMGILQARILEWAALPSSRSIRFYTYSKKEKYRGLNLFIYHGPKLSPDTSDRILLGLMTGSVSHVH